MPPFWSIQLTPKQKSFLGKWGKLGAGAGAGQIAVQVTGFAAGIGIIRLLPQDEYAYYTLANTMLGTMNILADGGIAAGVTSIGGAAWKSPRDLGAVLNTGLRMRNRFAVLCAVIVMPIIYYLYTKQPISSGGILTILVCLAPTFVTALSSSLYQVVPRLHQHIKALVRINVEVNLARLLLSVFPLLMFPYAAIALLGAGGAQFLGNRKYKHLMAENADLGEPWTAEIRDRIYTFVKRILPTSIYYCLSGQVTIWLLSIFGTTASIAQIGALSRLMVVFTLVQTTVDLLVTPRFARLPEDSQLVIPRFFQVIFVGAGLCGAILLGVLLFPDLLLFVLGDTYRDLRLELFLVTISSSLTMVSSLINKLSSSRGIVPNPVAFIGSQVLVQVLLIAFIIDYTTLRGVLFLSIGVMSTTLLFRLIHFLALAKGLNLDDSS